MGNALAAPHVNVLIVFHNFVQFFLNFLACLSRLPFVFDFVCRAPTVHCGEWENRGIYDMRASVSVCVRVGVAHLCGKFGISNSRRRQLNKIVLFDGAINS